MARASSINTLPKAVKEWLNKALLDGNFSGYMLLEKELKEQGYELSKSAIHRYGQRLEKRMAAIRASTEAARLIQESAADEGESRSEAVIALVQSDIFNILVDLQDAAEADPAKRVKMLASVGHAMADLTRASVSMRKYQNDLKSKVVAAAEQVDKVIRRGGLSDEAADEIRRQILGIVDNG